MCLENSSLEENGGGGGSNLPGLVLIVPRHRPCFHLSIGYNEVSVVVDGASSIKMNWRPDGIFYFSWTRNQEVCETRN